MKRGRLTALATGVAGGVVLGGLVIVEWEVVKHHLAAWHFVLTSETRAIAPRDLDAADRIIGTTGLFPVDRVYQHLADQADLTVVFDVRDRRRVQLEANPLSAGMVLTTLHENGYRIIEQRFPLAAYVVIDCPSSDEPPPKPPARRPQPPAVTVATSSP